MTLPLFLTTPGEASSRHARLFCDRAANDPVDYGTTRVTRAAPERELVVDSELVERLRHGDPSALTAVYDTHFDSLWRIAALQTRSASTAEDVVHDVFLWLWTRREQLSPTVDLRVYLAAATRNRARDIAKHAHVADTAIQKASAPNDVAGVGQGGPAADATVQTDEFFVAYQRGLQLLTERELTAALLRWEEGFTLEQIGAVLSVSPKGAQGIVLRAKQKMYEALQNFR